MTQRCCCGLAAWLAFRRMETDDREFVRRSRALESDVGHPGDLFEELERTVQDEGITKFSAVQDHWLKLMWSLDAFRVAGVPPRGMGKPTVRAQARLEAVYRSKGNWFATLLALLLQNHTEQAIRP